MNLRLRSVLVVREAAWRQRSREHLHSIEDCLDFDETLPAGPWGEEIAVEWMMIAADERHSLRLMAYDLGFGDPYKGDFREQHVV